MDIYIDDDEVAELVTESPQFSAAMSAEVEEGMGKIIAEVTDSVRSEVANLFKDEMAEAITDHFLDGIKDEVRPMIGEEIENRKVVIELNADIVALVRDEVQEQLRQTFRAFMRAIGEAGLL